MHLPGKETIVPGILVLSVTNSRAGKEPRSPMDGQYYYYLAAW